MEFLTDALLLGIQSNEITFLDRILRVCTARNFRTEGRRAIADGNYSDKYQKSVGRSRSVPTMSWFTVLRQETASNCSQKADSRDCASRLQRRLRKLGHRQRSEAPSSAPTRRFGLQLKLVYLRPRLRQPCASPLVLIREETLILKCRFGPSRSSRSRPRLHRSGTLDQCEQKTPQILHLHRIRRVRYRLSLP